MSKNSSNRYKRIKSKEEYIDYYKDRGNSQAYAKADLIGANPLITEVEIGLIFDIANKLKISKKGKVLDLATGSGRIIKELEKHFESCTGVDTSKYLLEKAKKRTKRSKFIQADIDNLPFPNESYDLICGFRFMINLPKKTRLAILREAVRVLKKNGLVAINFHLNKLSPRGIRDIVFNKRSSEKLLTPFAALSEFKDAGLKPVGIRGVNMAIIYRLFSFLPQSFLIRFDKFFGGLPIINYTSDSFIIFAEKI